MNYTVDGVDYCDECNSRLVRGHARGCRQVSEGAGLRGLIARLKRLDSRGRWL